MQEPGDVRSVPQPTTANARSGPSIWQRLKAFGLKKLFLVCVGIGAGLGFGVVATVASVVWLTSRPIPAHDSARTAKSEPGGDGNSVKECNRLVTPTIVMSVVSQLS
jgi:hypothetical protein